MEDQAAISTVSVDVLIVGAGPAGASLACFLGFYGMACPYWKSFEEALQGLALR